MISYFTFAEGGQQISTSYKLWEHFFRGRISGGSMFHYQSTKCTEHDII